MFLIRWIRRVLKGIVNLFLLAFVLLLLAMGPIFGIATWLEYRASQQVERHSELAQATIEDVERVNDQGYLEYFAHYSYEVAGQRHQVSEKVVEKQVFESLARGQVVPVYYSPDDPTESRLVANISDFNADMWIAFLIFSGIWCWILYSASSDTPSPVFDRIRTNGLWFLGMLSFLSIVMMVVPSISHRSQSLLLLLPFVLSLSVLLLVPLVMGSIRHLWRVKGRQPRLEDYVAQEVEVMPRGPRNLPEQLHTLGFEYIGKSSYAEIPDDQLLYHFKHPHEPIYATYWYAAKASYYGYATALEAVRFDSYFGESGIVRTSYPIGEHIQTQQFETHFTEASLPDAYQIHLERISAWSQREGLPNNQLGMDGLLYWEGLFWERYGRRYQRRKFSAELVAIGAFITIPSFWLWWFWAYRTWEITDFHIGLAAAFVLLWLCVRSVAWAEYHRRTPPYILFPTESVPQKEKGKHKTDFSAREAASSVTSPLYKPMTSTKALEQKLLTPKVDYASSSGSLFPLYPKPIGPSPIESVGILIFITVVALVILAAVWYTSIAARQYNHEQTEVALRSQRTTAHLTHWRCASGGGLIVGYLEYEFMVEDNAYTGKGIAGPCSDPAPSDDNFPIYYLPSDPTLNVPVDPALRHRKSESWWLSLCITAVIIPILMMVGVFLLVLWRVHQEQQERLSSKATG